MNVIVSKPNKALAVPRTEGMMRLFPEGKPLDNYWVIKHDLGAYHLLSRLGLRLPNPISCYYDWAGGKPFDVQRLTASLLVANPRSYVLNDMGTGKTRAVLWGWDYLRSNSYCGRLLVVAPLSTLKLVWGGEAFRAVPHRKVQVLHGSKKERLKRLTDPEAEIFVINHDGLKVIGDEILKLGDIDVLCIDELATYRNANDRSRAMAKFAAKMKWVWGLTGSPMPNEPTDVWMQAKIITPHTVPKYRSHARDMLMTKITDYIFVPKPTAIETAYSWMQPAVRFTLDDVVELPDVVTRTIDVPMSPKQTEIYKTISREFVAMVEKDQITAVNAAAAMNKLLQIAGGYVYSNQFKALDLNPEPRLEILKDLIQAATGKVLVFCPFRHMVEALSTYFGGERDDGEFALIHGDVPPGRRNEVFDKFQSTPQYKFILAHPGCMAHGLTLTAADTIIWYCPITSLELYEQANARIRRVGQRHRQQVIHLQGTPVERRIYSLLQKKANVQDMLLQLFKDATDAVAS